MANNTITGQIIHVGEIERFPSGFVKREFVIDTGGQYPDEIIFEQHKDQAENGNLVPGTEVEVSYNLRGRRVEKEGEPTRWFNTLVAWRVKPFARYGNRAEQPQQAPAAPAAAPAPPQQEYTGYNQLPPQQAAAPAQAQQQGDNGAF